MVRSKSSKRNQSVQHTWNNSPRYFTDAASDRILGYMCGAMVSVVAFKAKGREFDSTDGCSHTVQKPSISSRLLASAR